MKQREVFFTVMGMIAWGLLIAILVLIVSWEGSQHNLVLEGILFFAGLGFFLLAWRNNAGAEAYLRHRRTLIMLQRILEQLERVEGGTSGTGSRTNPE
ncbi:MAG: hypothetical protein KO463_08140 [Candidatus Methanofastidiosa archaeon]|nr:hypothetical protein [Candidatus Methanofastidiosa archaeon]